MTLLIAFRLNEAINCAVSVWFECSLPDLCEDECHLSSANLHKAAMVCLIFVAEHLTFVKLLITRKSSCVNARGMATAAYQVLHLLTEVGYPPRWGTLCRGTTPLAGPGSGTPHRGTPSAPGWTGSGTSLAGSGSGTTACTWNLVNIFQSLFHKNYSYDTAT